MWKLLAITVLFTIFSNGREGSQEVDKGHGDKLGGSHGFALYIISII